MGDPTLPFGPYRGKRFAEIPRQYLAELVCKRDQARAMERRAGGKPTTTAIDHAIREYLHASSVE